MDIDYIITDLLQILDICLMLMSIRDNIFIVWFLEVYPLNMLLA